MRAARVVLVNGAASAGVIAVAWLGLQADRLWPFALPAGLIPAAWPLLAVGTLLILAAEVAFLRTAHATGATGDAPSRLVAAGPFRCVRNPIYLGATLLLFGVDFLRQSPTLLLATLALLPAVEIYVRRFEEPRLERRFGDDYRRYKATVPRWFPRCRKGPMKAEADRLA
jgi:protein-S-isoprenylcysteine O-methyltransferase Ste14